MKRSPSLRQLQTLRAIADFRACHAYGPSYRDLMAELDVKSSNAVACLLRPLEKAGLITRDEKIARSLSITKAGRRWVVPSAALLSGSEVAEVA